MSDKNLLRATFLLFCSRFVIAFLIELTPQEAYYWNYALHPALSYFDHPPVDLNPPDLESLRKYFARVDDDVTRIPVMKAGRVLRYFYAVKCFDYLGAPPAV